MTRMILAAVLIAGVSGKTLADSWAVGYQVVPLSIKYVQENMATNQQTQMEDKASPGSFLILYSLERKATDSLRVGLTTGVGIPLGSGKLEQANVTDMEKKSNLPAVPNYNTIHSGDSVEWNLGSIPILIGGRYVLPSGSISLGLQAGPVLVFGNVKDTDVDWGGPLNQTKNKTTVTYYNDVVPVLGVFVTPSVEVGESVRITALVGMMTSKKVNMFEEVDNESPTATMLPLEERGAVIGGLSWGINVAWVEEF